MDSAALSSGPAESKFQSLNQDGVRHAQSMHQPHRLTDAEEQVFLSGEAGDKPARQPHACRRLYTRGCQLRGRHLQKLTLLNAPSHRCPCVVGIVCVLWLHCPGCLSDVAAVWLDQQEVIKQCALP